MAAAREKTCTTAVEMTHPNFKRSAMMAKTEKATQTKTRPKCPEILKK